MSFLNWMYYISTHVLFVPFIFILLASILLSLKSKFIQIRAIPVMVKMLVTSIKERNREGNSTQQTIPAHKALFTSMSTTIGIGNIVGPIIAIGLGGPGALGGFILATIFGSAVTFYEVCLALKYRKKLADGSFIGGPMQYLKKGLHPILAQIYAYSGLTLLVAWSSNQSNTLGIILEPHGISREITGLTLAILITIILIGGIKRIGNINEFLVPIMFILYSCATIWVIASHWDNLPATIRLVWDGLLNPASVLGAAGGITTIQVLRHGLARALQTNEAGVGTSTFAHSMAQVNNPVQQAILAMLSVYSNGVLCVLSGLTILITGAWQEKGARFDISMISKIIDAQFPVGGALILTLCAFLFAIGTILGNAYNGSQCYLYATKNRGLRIYYLITAVVVFFGSILDAHFVWTIVDFFILPVALINTVGVIYLSFKDRISSSF